MKAIAIACIGALVAPLTCAAATTALFSSARPSVTLNAGHRVDGVPERLVGLYVGAAAQCPGLPWTIVAAIGAVESDHGRHGDSRMRADGRMDPPIIGIALDGTNNTLAIADTDDGRWDADTTWDRAVGPMQFIPTTWRLYGTDASGDGVADPHNYYDAVYATAAYLCAHGAGDAERRRDAILAYNNAGWYADLVLTTAERYAQQGGPR